MEYDNVLFNELQKTYNVTLINYDFFAMDILREYSNKNIIHKFFRKLNNKIKCKDKEHIECQYDKKFLQQISNEKNYYQIVFCINGAYTSKWFIHYIKELNPNATMIYYAWDDISKLFSINHIELFDKIYSYNIDDCKLHNWTYLPMFVQKKYIGHKKENLYDIFYIGTVHSDRIEIAEKLIEKYSGKLNLLIYLYDPSNSHNKSYCHNKPLSYDEYLELLSVSKSILDIPLTNQTGPTTRIFDGLLTDSKVITTNNQLYKYPVFSDNILVIDRNTLDIPLVFLETEYNATTYCPFTPKEWINQIDFNGVEI